MTLHHVLLQRDPDGVRPGTDLDRGRAALARSVALTTNQHGAS
jgi:hypothetical protein